MKWLILLVLASPELKVRPAHLFWHNGPICAEKVSKRHLPCVQDIEIWDVTLDHQAIIIKAEGKTQKWEGGDQTHDYKARSLGYDTEDMYEKSPWVYSIKVWEGAK